MQAELPLGPCRGRGERGETGVSLGGGAPAAGTWGRKTRPGTRAAAGAKNNARAPAPTAARRVPLRPRAHRRAPRPLRPGSRAGSRRGARDTCAHFAALATRGGASRGAPGLSAPPRPVSPPTPSGLGRGPGRLLTGPQAHRDLPAAIASRASRCPLQAEGICPGTGVAVVVALLGRLSQAHATASCHSVT